MATQLFRVCKLRPLEKGLPTGTKACPHHANVWLKSAHPN